MKQIQQIVEQFFLILSLFLCALSERKDYVADYSDKHLGHVPHNLPPQTTVLCLSQNQLSAVQVSDVSYLPKLMLLNLSHNLIGELDFSIFTSNNDLQYLDVSHNSLQNCRCGSLHRVRQLKHLDLSYNKFRTMSLCQEFRFLLEMKYLGLSASEIQTSDFAGIESVELESVFLGLEDLSNYTAGSLRVLNTNKLHIVLPTDAKTHFLLLDAINTSRTLELSNIRCEKPCYYPTSPLSQINKSSKLNTLIFSNITMPFSNIARILQSVINSSVEYFNIYSVTVVHDFHYVKFHFSNSSLKQLTIKHMTNKVYLYHGIHPDYMYSEFIVKNFTLSDSEAIHVICPSENNIFHFLNVSENIITDNIFQDCRSLALLEILDLRSNKLEDLSKVSEMTSTMPSLKYLDISKNPLHYELGKKCNWSKSLIVLKLSSSGITGSVFECLPSNIQILDLQNNHITSMVKPINALSFLEELNLASNRLTDLPDCSHFSRLAILNVEMNSIVSPSSESSQTCRNVKKINAGNNPFLCDCTLREFISQAKKSPERLSGRLTTYRCEHPEAFRGMLLKDFNVSEISCDMTLLFVVILTTTVVLVLCIYLLCRYLNVPWYARMMWQWTRTKYRIRNMTTEEFERDLIYHAFVSYSEHDSAWVKNILLPNLEKEDGSIRICQHERNFIPGKGIIENIINCIEKSYKSIFVLSCNFIKSEWCHYELYFAHHRLFCEKCNSLILILLEPIPQYLIPARCNKLKALLAKRTYLEWPKERSKQGLFWANLREAITINLPKPQKEMETLLYCKQKDELTLDTPMQAGQC